ncbi:thiamine pyrophosphate-dependent acetolactate synthase large subunit-like protein [Bradyrhizobium sp. USDA 4473]
MLKDVASACVAQASSRAQVRHLIDRAARIALARRTVTAVILPNDLQVKDCEDPPRAHSTLRSGIGYTPLHIVPHEAELDRAADILNAVNKIAMLVGAGALGATARSSRLQTGYLPAAPRRCLAKPCCQMTFPR